MANAHTKGVKIPERYILEFRRAGRVKGVGYSKRSSIWTHLNLSRRSRKLFRNALLNLLIFTRYLYFKLMAGDSASDRTESARAFRTPPSVSAAKAVRKDKPPNTLCDTQKEKGPIAPKGTSLRSERPTVQKGEEAVAPDGLRPSRPTLLVVKLLLRLEMTLGINRIGSSQERNFRPHNRQGEIR